MSIYEEGYEAYTYGIVINPYPILSAEWYEWDEGWESSEADELAQREFEDEDL